MGTLAPLCDFSGDFQVRGKVKRGLVVIGYCLVLLEPEVDMNGTDKMYVYLEPVCPLFWWLNPSKQGLNSNQNKGHLGSRYKLCKDTPRIQMVPTLVLILFFLHLCET